MHFVQSIYFPWVSPIFDNRNPYALHHDRIWAHLWNVSKEKFSCCDGTLIVLQKCTYKCIEKLRNCSKLQEWSKITALESCQCSACCLKTWRETLDAKQLWPRAAQIVSCREVSLVVRGKSLGNIKLSLCSHKKWTVQGEERNICKCSRVWWKAEGGCDRILNSGFGQVGVPGAFSAEPLERAVWWHRLCSGCKGTRCSCPGQGGRETLEHIPYPFDLQALMFLSVVAHFCSGGTLLWFKWQILSVLIGRS